MRRVVLFTAFYALLSLDSLFWVRLFLDSNLAKIEHSSILLMGPASVCFLSFLIPHQARDKDSGSFGQITYSLEGDTSRWVTYIYLPFRI